MNITWQGIIATPFGYVIDCIYNLIGNYGLTLILFAGAVQLAMLLIQLVRRPLDKKVKSNSEKMKLIRPLVAKIREDHADDIEKQNELIVDLYSKEKISLLGNFLLSALAGILRFALPFLVLIPIFQVLAQPITYMFHETPETAAAIVRAMREEAPELFVHGYNQVIAIANIQDYADVIKQAVPEVSERTLQGLSYSFLGIDMNVVLGVHVLGKGVWAWDWAHIGALLLPVVYMGRRAYLIFSRMIKSLIDYSKKKKRAKKLCLTMPKMPNPPLLDLMFLFLSVTAMATVPVSMDLYWLFSSLFSVLFAKLAKGFLDRKTIKAAEAAATGD